MELIDSHIHTYHCEHAKGSVFEVVEGGLKKGVKNFGFCEHFTSDHLETLPRTGDNNETVLTPKDEFEKYRLDIKKAKQIYKEKGVKIRFGTEVDYFKDHDQKIESELGKIKELDFIMGSVHFAGNPGRFFDYYSGRLNDEEILKEYADLLARCIKTGLFDVIGHLDQVKFNLEDSEVLEESSFYEDIVALLKEYGAGVDVNTKLSEGENGTFESQRVTPGPKMLKLCKENDIPMILGSDAHSPSQVSRNFKETISYLKSLGINKLAYFEKRTPIYYEI